MTSAQRRQEILSALHQTKQPLSATVLAQQFSVSRQVIVGDIALLRAQGHQITATPRGYLIPVEQGLLRQLACCHSSDGTRAELNAMVDCGCTVLDVIVEHPVYGQLTAPLQLSSRLDVEQFVERMQSAGAQPLSLLTEGIHLHTLSCPNEEAFLRLQRTLQDMGMLVQ
ncbi:MAG: transcription repressor NadR [Ruminococcaceae bacterium]|nr:transcription repressor NadR [Oscillospiraceae bacterium]